MQEKEAADFDLLCVIKLTLVVQNKNKFADNQVG